MTLEFDLSVFERKAREIGGAIDQLPFALSKALNDAAEATRSKLINEVWPAHVQVRDPNFLDNALTLKGGYATKRNLRIELSNTGRAGARGHLRLHAKGGTKQAEGNLAIPDSKILGRRRARGMPKNLRPANLPNSFRRGDVIFQRTGGKKRRGLRLMYTLQPSASIRADVPFHEEFRRLMREEMQRSFPIRMKEAMSTRRAR